MDTTLQIQIKDGKFVAHNNRDVKEFSENHAEGNNWRCIIEENGEFYCTAIQECNGQRYRLKFKIEADGMVKQSLRIGDAKFQKLKSYKLEQWPTDGVIVLPASFMNGHKPYFREESFQNFLDEYGLGSVRCESANAMYCLEEETYNGKTNFSEKIETDGEMIEIIDIFDYPGNATKQYFWRYREVEVSGATWVIKKITKNGVTQRILFTRGNPRKLEGLPKP